MQRAVGLFHGTRGRALAEMPHARDHPASEQLEVPPREIGRQGGELQQADEVTEAYLALGLEQEAQKNAAVLGYNFPSSDWYEDSYALLNGGASQ